MKNRSRQKASGASGCGLAGKKKYAQNLNFRITLKPAAVLEIDTYSDAQIAAWDREDVLSADEHMRILARLLAA